jgi:hypothetical protein
VNLPSIKRAGSTTLHRNRLKTSFYSATYGPKALRSIYRDLHLGRTRVRQGSRDTAGYVPPILNATNAGECDIVGSLGTCEGFPSFSLIETSQRLILSL